MFWNCCMKKERGSYTVEAAFIVPMILGIVFMILYLLLWHHDRCVLQAELQDQIFLTAQEGSDGKRSIKELQKKLWIMIVDQKEVSLGGLLIKGRITAHSGVRIPLLTFVLHEDQKIELQETYPVKQPDEVRRYRKKEESQNE